MTRPELEPERGASAPAGVPVIAVGASAGGVEALRDLVRLLPEDLAACVLIVLHVAPGSPSALSAILRRSTRLTVLTARHGDVLRPGTVLVAQPDHHLLVTDGEVVLTHGPTENGHRPAVDVLFRSAARAKGARVAAVVLSGALDDGAAGSLAVAAGGGLVLAQDPDEALYPSMPEAAVRHAGARRLPVGEMPRALREWLAGLTDQPPGPGTAPHLEMEVRLAELDPDAVHALDRPGDPAGFGCPDCAGALFQVEEGGLRRYRCRVGHAWSPESLLTQQTIAMEGALWMALRTLQEKAALNHDMASRAHEDGHALTAGRFESSAGETLRAAELVRRLIQDIGSTGLPHDLTDEVGERAGTD